MQRYPIAKDLVLVGGGHSHVVLLRMLGMKPVSGLQVTLISPDVRTPYSGMLPGVVAGHYSEAEIHIDLVPLCRFAGVRFIQAEVDAIDTLNNHVRLPGRPDLHYDVLSLDIGITPAIDDVSGARDFGIAVKPIGEFLQKWYAFLARVEAGNVTSVGFVGAGAGGLELCLAVLHRLSRQGAARPVACHVFCDGTVVLPGYPLSVQSRFGHHLQRQGVQLHLDFRVARVDGNTIESARGQKLAIDEVFFVTQAAAQPWLRNTGLDLNPDGFINVRNTLQSANIDNVFAAGDTAHLVGQARPKAGVFAVRQGPVLYRNIVRYLLGKTPRPYTPQRQFLSLVTTGNRNAVASRNGFSVEGRWVWAWKDWIDRRFMDRFRHLPPMKARFPKGLLDQFDDQVQCGGCGAKVSADLLRDVLAELGVGGGALDDAAIYAVPEGELMLHSVDAFRAFIDDPWTFARIAVNHAVSDIYAMGGKPVTAMAVVTLPHATATASRSMLMQLLGGAVAQLTEDGITLVGGHTSEGMELSIGFVVNGVAKPDQLWRKAGMMTGDALVLTRPLGSGALFAADMQSSARGEWVEVAIAQMLKSNRAACAVLQQFEVHAATDVTGFGLAGHLAEMLQASGKSAVIDLSRVPVLEGTQHVLAEGITSTLHAANKRSVANLVAAPDAAAEILFDPQTAGGLLVAVPEDQVVTLLAALHSAGYLAAARIGTVVNAMPSTITVR